MNRLAEAPAVTHLPNSQLPSVPLSDRIDIETERNLVVRWVYLFFFVLHKPFNLKLILTFVFGFKVYMARSSWVDTVHMFHRRSPYKWRPGVNTMLRNNVRLAKVWMMTARNVSSTGLEIIWYSCLQLHCELSYWQLEEKMVKLEKDFGLRVDCGVISDRVRLRKSLGDKPFKGFLDEVYPEIIQSWTRFNFLRSHFLYFWALYLVSSCVSPSRERNGDLATSS